MTAPEINVSAWLTKKKIPFNFQSQLIGGYSQTLGDDKVVFELYELMTLFRIQGENKEAEGKDLIQKERLKGMGYTVVDLWEKDLTSTKLDYTLNEAIQGREIGS